MSPAPIGEWWKRVAPPDLFYSAWVDKKCKVCKSDYRPFIDQLLLEGVSQAAVLRMANRQARQTWFSKSSIQRHATNHIHPPLPKLRNFDRLPETPIDGKLARTRRNLETIHERSQAAIEAGLVPSNAQGLIASIHELTRLEKLEEYDTVYRLLEEVHLFVAAIDATITPELGTQILSTYHSFLDERDEQQQREEELEHARKLREAQPRKARQPSRPPKGLSRKVRQGPAVRPRSDR